MTAPDTRGWVSGAGLLFVGFLEVVLVLEESRPQELRVVFF